MVGSAVPIRTPDSREVEECACGLATSLVPGRLASSERRCVGVSGSMVLFFDGIGRKRHQGRPNVGRTGSILLVLERSGNASSSFRKYPNIPLSPDQLIQNPTTSEFSASSRNPAFIPPYVQSLQGRQQYVVWSPLIRLCGGFVKAFWRCKP